MRNTKALSVVLAAFLAVSFPVSVWAIDDASLVAGENEVLDAGLEPVDGVDEQDPAAPETDEADEQMPAASYESFEVIDGEVSSDTPVVEGEGEGDKVVLQEEEPTEAPGEPFATIDADEPSPGAIEDEALSAQAESAGALLSYSTHVQNLGWQTSMSDGKTAGTTGKGLRLESFRVALAGSGLPKGDITYRSQVQNVGWLPWVSNGHDCGTTGRGLRMEAIQIRLSGALADEYDIYYRVHVQNYGWLAWAKNGAVAGSTGKSLRLEGMQVVLVKKGEAAPQESPASALSKAFIDGTSLSVRAHVQNVGWLRAVGSGKIAGTTGRSLRVEALRVSLSGARVPGGIEGTAHVQNVGWQRWSKNGDIVGTSGRSLRVEAIRYRLTGEAADEWDLYYRVHVQNIGWLSWAKNGEVAGTEGYSARIEAVEFFLCDKGAAAPRDDYHFEGPFALSGDELVDSYVWRTVSERGWKGESGLRAAFDYVCSFPLKRTSNWPGPNTDVWSVTFAKEMLLKGGGNCHRYAALMRWFAKALGYEARVVPGMLGGAHGSDHGWLEIDVDGVTYVADPAVQNAYPEYNWFLIRYEDAKLKYYDLDGNRILK